MKIFGMFLLMLLAAGGVEAVEKSITTVDGDMGADSSVSFDSPDKNHGHSRNLPVKAQVTVPKGAFKGYLRFDLKDAPKPAIGARLELHTTSINFPNHGAISDMEFEVWGLADGHPGEDWQESEITWNNAPANQAESGREIQPATEDNSGAVHLGTFVIPSTLPDDEQRVIALESTTAAHPLVDFLNADKNGHVTFILTRPGNPASHNSVFAAKEAKSLPPPTLTIVGE